MSFPSYGDAVDIAQLQAAVSEMVTSHTKSGTAVLATNGSTSRTLAVAFTSPFSTPPRVVASIANGNSVTGWSSRAIAVTTSGFTVYALGSAAVGVDITVYWVATDLGND